MFDHIFHREKDPHSVSKKKDYDFSLSDKAIGLGGYSEVRLARWHPKEFPPVVGQWIAQQDEYYNSHPGSSRGERIVENGKGKEGLVVAVKVVKKEAVRNNPEYFKILKRCVASRLYLFSTSELTG